MHSISKYYTITIEPYSVEVFYNFNNKWINNDELFIQQNVQKPFKSPRMTVKIITLHLTARTNYSRLTVHFLNPWRQIIIELLITTWPPMWANASHLWHGRDLWQGIWHLCYCGESCQRLWGNRYMALWRQQIHRWRLCSSHDDW